MCLRLLPSSATFAALLILGAPGLGWAYLGSFEESDGYRIPGTNGIFNIPSLEFSGDAAFFLNNIGINRVTGIVPPGAYPNTNGDGTHGQDVTRYNAGQYGTGGGGPGGTALDIPDNSGLWRALMGGRLNEDIGAPLYLGGPFQRDYIAAYAYGNARTGSQVLNLLAYDQDMRYSYSLDSRDFNGLSPLSTSDMRIELSYWTCPTDADDGMAIGVNTVAMSFKDSLGQTLVDVGYTGDNFLQYRVGGSSTWQTTSLALGTTGWSEVKLTIDTYSNSISLGARRFDDLNGMLIPFTTTLLTNQSLGFDTANVTEIEWTATDVDGFKNFFDDFAFNLTPVPEPSGALLVLLTTFFAMRRRRANVG
jgi:hypothetical protein